MLFPIWFILFVKYSLVNGNGPSPITPQCPLPCLHSNGQESKVKERPFIITVEGSIAAGKSTLLKMIEQLSHDVIAVYEPIDSWKSTIDQVGGPKVLYEGGRGFFPLVMKIMVSFIKFSLQEPILPNGQLPKALIRERSLYAERYCFLEYYKLRGMISDLEYQIADEWSNLAMETYREQMRPDLISKLTYYCFNATDCHCH